MFFLRLKANLNKKLIYFLSKYTSFHNNNYQYNHIFPIYPTYSYMLHTDYSYHGVVLVLIFYYYRNNRFLASLVGYVWFLSSPWTITAFIAVLFYNGKRGKGLKYFFYAFYPAHLLLLYGLRVLSLGY